VFNELSLI